MTNKYHLHYVGTEDMYRCRQQLSVLNQSIPTYLAISRSGSVQSKWRPLAARGCTLCTCTPRPTRRSAEDAAAPPTGGDDERGEERPSRRK